MGCVRRQLSVLFVVLIATHAEAWAGPQDGYQVPQDGYQVPAGLNEREVLQQLPRFDPRITKDKLPRNEEIAPDMAESESELSAALSNRNQEPLQSRPEISESEQSAVESAELGAAKDSKERFCVVIDDDGHNATVQVWRYHLSDSPLGFSHLTKIAEHKNTFSILADHLPFHESPGHSDVTHDEHLAVMADHLNHMINFARSHIPDHLVQFANISFLASCGAWTTDSQSLQATMEEIRSLLADRTINHFNFHGPGAAVVLSGEEQAAWSWVALNYLNGFFDKIEAPKSSLGVMGLNKHSAFISFFTDGAILAGEHTITLARRKYRIYAKSHVGFGSSDILKKVVEENMQWPIHNNPCLLQGDHWPLDVQGTAAHVLVNGTGDPDSCIELIRNVIDVRGCQLDTCSIHNIYQPMLPEGMRFHAVQDFSHTPLNRHCYHGDEHYMNTINVLVQGINFCHEQNMFKSSPLSNRRCLLSLYAPLLMSAFGYPEGSNTVISSSKLNGELIEPALGMVIMHVNDAIQHISKAQSPVNFNSPELETSEDSVQDIQDSMEDIGEDIQDNVDELAEETFDDNFATEENTEDLSEDIQDGVENVLEDLDDSFDDEIQDDFEFSDYGLDEELDAQVENSPTDEAYTTDFTSEPYTLGDDE